MSSRIGRMTPDASVRSGNTRHWIPPGTCGSSRPNRALRESATCPGGAAGAAGASAGAGDGIASTGGRSICGGAGSGATGSGIDPGGRSTSEPPGAARLAAGGVKLCGSPSDCPIGEEPTGAVPPLVNGCAHNGEALKASTAMAKAMPEAARPAIVSNALIRIVFGGNRGEFKPVTLPCCICATIQPVLAARACQMPSPFSRHVAPSSRSN